MPDTETQHAPPPSEERTPAQKRRGQLLLALTALVVLGLAGYGIYWYTYASHYVSTDNAYVGAETAEVTPLVSAPVARVLVSETQSVNAGDVLIELDASDATLALTQARAELARAQSDYSRARVDLTRRRALAPGGAVSADELTTAQNAFSASSAAVEAAQARVDSAALTLTRMTIRAPIAGVISDKNVQVGQRVEAGAHLMVIAPIADAYVDAN